LSHESEHDAVVDGVEGSFEVRVHSAGVLVAYFIVFHNHDEAGEGFVDAAEKAESVMLVAKDFVLLVFSVAGGATSDRYRTLCILARCLSLRSSSVVGLCRSSRIRLCHFCWSPVTWLGLRGEGIARGGGCIAFCYRAEGL
jgi:hypothetical protein